MHLEQGGDYGWPECYFDNFQKKLVLAPEYGGDGGKKVGVCAEKKGPVAFFPAHWAPNDLLIYTGKAFPAPYQGGAFVAFHGSWNRAPAPQGGYNVVFQPMRDGKASGDFITFADGFAGAVKEPGRAAFRPTGLAMGPDGAIYISDDVKGRIWRITYRGAADATRLRPRSHRMSQPQVPTAPFRQKARIPTPGARTLLLCRSQSGRPRIRSRSATASSMARPPTEPAPAAMDRTPKARLEAPDLTTGTFVQSDGSFQALIKTINDGVPKPRNYSDPMPPKGGAPLSDADVSAVAAYVWAISHLDGK